MNEPGLPGLAARRRSLFWRIHFWAALIASPFALVATLTGALYIFTPQIEAGLYGRLERVAPQGARLPLDAAVAAAVDAAPAGKLTVFVDPYRATVLGSQRDEDRFSEWARRLHSRLLQGESLRWMIELAASWMLVMLLTGVWLWWPRSDAAGQPALPRAGVRGRAGWRQWHAFLGVLLGVLSLAMVLTGVTWSKYAGENVRALRDRAGQASPKVPERLHSMPQGGQQPVSPMSFQQAWDRTRALVPGALPQLAPPRGPHGVWRASSADRRHPQDRFDLVLDAYGGQVLYRAGWERQTVFGKATAVGIPFHRGELGVWNQVLLFVFAAGVLFSLVSGWAMFFKRRRSGLAGLPKLAPGAWRAAPPAAVAIGIGLCALMPLLALSAAVVAAVEAALGWRRRRDGAAAA
jgi:uncharacterized iron-regulated membrane protein